MRWYFERKLDKICIYNIHNISNDCSNSQGKWKRKPKRRRATKSKYGRRSNKRHDIRSSIIWYNKSYIKSKQACTRNIKNNLWTIIWIRLWIQITKMSSKWLGQNKCYNIPYKNKKWCKMVRWNSIYNRWCYIYNRLIKTNSINIWKQCSIHNWGR